MNNKQKEDFNLQIRKILKQFGVKAHNLVKKRFENDLSDCKISIKLTVDSKHTHEINNTIKLDN